ncbi:MAG: galactose oxidase [Candidatus Lokiarchaeota archaeon]|nr:galactose oxidase [Candidatus Lokiarchaeota archaeon]
MQQKYLITLAFFITVTIITAIFIAVFLNLNLNNASNDDGNNTLVENPPIAPFMDEILPNPDYDGIIDLNWSDVNGATTYYLYRYTSLIVSTNGLTPIYVGVQSNHTDSGLPCGIFHYVAVAGNSSGNSSISNCENVTIEPPHNSWTWISGSNSVNQLGVYGEKGVTDGNNIPGGRDRSTSSVAPDGSFWLFGGDIDSIHYLNDLWKFDGENWMWVSGSSSYYQTGVYNQKGVANASNCPGARADSISWITPDGSFWLFGGVGNCVNASGLLNDLWKFDGANWTWMSGSDYINQKGYYGEKGVADAINVPGARSSSISWIDQNGSLWLFGGYGYNNDTSGRLGDLWRYNITDGQWTWISGSYSLNTLGIYGQKGIADSSNVPGARERSISWVDGNSSLWLFGGNGFNNLSYGRLNDLWRYNITDGQWTWVSGSYSTYSVGEYGQKGVANENNMPGSRNESISWIDQEGYLWLFGGNGFNNVTQGVLNDLWKFDGANWTWVSGNYSVDQLGEYNQKGVANINNIPGSRQQSISWVAQDGTFWLFGGLGYTNSTSGYLNDLWSYKI